MHQYIRKRAANQKHSAKLAIVSGLDHVAVYDGQVPETHTLFTIAKKRGYTIFISTGRTEKGAHRLLKAAGYNGLYDEVDSCPGPFGEKVARCKARYRQDLIDRGYTIVLNMGSHETVWRRQPGGDRTLKLRY